MEFKDLYKGYVIRERSGMFIGENSFCYRVYFRHAAARFTKAEAEEYIKTGLFCKDGGPFYIEDAV